MNMVVDARGRSCPEPVILTRQALAQHKGKSLTILVDASVAKENVSRFITGNTGQTPEVKEAEGYWEITVKGSKC